MVGLVTRPAIERAGTETPHLQRGAPDFYPNGGGRGECEPAKHGPDSEPGNRVTGAGAHTARCENIAKRRYTPEVGAVCPNWARTDLCGGRAVMRVPTAINGRFWPGMGCLLLTRSEERRVGKE